MSQKQEQEPEQQEVLNICSLATENIYYFLRHSSVDDIMLFGHTCRQYRDIIKDRHIWIQLLQRDFSIDLSENHEINPRQQYIQLYSDTNATYGSENYLAVNLCLYRALLKNNESLVNYFLDKGFNDWNLLAFMGGKINNSSLINRALEQGSNPIFVVIGALSVRNIQFADEYIRLNKIDTNYDMYYFYLAYNGIISDNKIPTINKLKLKKGLLNHLLVTEKFHILRQYKDIDSINFLGACAGGQIDYVQTIPIYNEFLYTHHGLVSAGYSGSIEILNGIRSKIEIGNIGLYGVTGHTGPYCNPNFFTSNSHLYRDVIRSALFNHQLEAYRHLKQYLPNEDFSDEIIRTNNLNLLSHQEITTPQHLEALAYLGNYQLFKETISQITDDNIIAGSIDKAVWGGNKLIVKECLNAYKRTLDETGSIDRIDSNNEFDIAEYLKFDDITKMITQFEESYLTK